MAKKVSKKIQVWQRKDFVNNALVYLLNTLVVFGIFVLFVYLNSLSGKIEDFNGYFSDFAYPLQFLILSVVLFFAMAIYFYYTDRDFLKDPANSEMVFLIIEISAIVCFCLGHFINIYIRPLALVALLMLSLGKMKHAVVTDFIFCLIMSLFDLFTTPVTEGIGLSEYSSLVIGFSSGLIAIFVMNSVYSRIKLLIRSFYFSVPILISIIIPVLVYDEGVSIPTSFVSGVVSGPIAAIIYSALLPVMESLFKKVTGLKLAELTDHKAKVVKRLIKEAPGTFNHAIVVSNLAEACAIAIDEDSILARTCAYYHDIGKLRRPEFFSENQVEGNNLHDDLTPELSTNIIKAHTKDGYKLALKNGLPKEIADVCLEHHGTMPILYFYDKAKKFTDGEVDINEYCYPGPKPQSKISAIVMIADGSEAVVRTLKDRSRANVKEAVRSIVNERMELGQFDECEITIKELNIIINTIVNNLSGVYHNRAEYPKVNLNGLKKEASGIKDEKENG